MNNNQSNNNNRKNNYRQEKQQPFLLVRKSFFSDPQKDQRMCPTSVFCFHHLEARTVFDAGRQNQISSRKRVVSEVFAFWFCLSCKTTVSLHFCPTWRHPPKNGHKIGHFSKKTDLLQKNSGLRATNSFETKFS